MSARNPGRSAALALSAVVLLLSACSTEGAPEAGDLPPQAAEGLAVARRFNCTGCHTSDGGDSLGPTWRRLAGSERELVTGEVVVADQDYLRRAIQEPGAEVVAGFRSTMPTQDLTGDDIDAVIAYIEALGD